MSKHYGQLIANNQMAIAEQMQRIQDLKTIRSALFSTTGDSYKQLTQQIRKCQRQMQWHEKTIAKLMSELRQQPTFHELPRTVA